MMLLLKELLKFWKNNNMAMLLKDSVLEFCRNVPLNKILSTLTFKEI